MTAVDELREAARLIRECAEKAPPGPWDLRDGWGPHLWDGKMRARRIASSDNSTVLDVSDDLDADLRGTREAFEHIASWHPGVALAVADWLDFATVTASQWEQLGVRDPAKWPEPTRMAHLIARAFLGRQP